MSVVEASQRVVLGSGSLSKPTRLAAPAEATVLALLALPALGPGGLDDDACRFPRLL